jgi:hypothetical protein
VIELPLVLAPAVVDETGFGSFCLIGGGVSAGAGRELCRARRSVEGWRELRLGESGPEANPCR